MSLFLSILLSLCLASVAFFKKSLDSKALLVAFIFSVVICYVGGLVAYIILVVVFLLTVLSDKIKLSEKRNINENIILKSEAKDVFQIVANVGPSVFFLGLYYFTRNISFLVSYAVVMAEALADSLGSNVGVLSKKNPVNILTFKRGIKGLSGNISCLGIFSSLLGSVIIALLFMFIEFKFSYFLIIFIFGFFGSIIDSLLGAWVQVKYRCALCGKVTEKKQHCHKLTEYYSGVKCFNNDFINLISNFTSGLLSLMFFWLIS